MLWRPLARTLAHPGTWRPPGMHAPLPRLDPASFPSAPPSSPSDPIANIVCSSIQPLQCYAVIGLADGKLGSSESLQIVQHYTDKGFRAIEKLLEGCDSKYATGDEVQLADVFLAPQIHAGVTRFQIDMSKYPLLARFYEAYMEIPAFQVARPEDQPDAPSS